MHQLRCSNAACGHTFVGDQTARSTCPACGSVVTVPSIGIDRETPKSVGPQRREKSSVTLDLPGGSDAAKQSTLDAPAAFADTRSFATDVTPRKIGRFHIRAKLGEGTFGEVFQADDPQLDRVVALKVAKPGTLTTPAKVSRFLREARAAANLRHPNIVPLFETGQDGPRYFIVTAFIPGRTLQAVVDETGKTGLDATTAARIARKLADALGYAHAQGIIHRDVKPLNVMLDEHGEPHLMDFGLAARTDAGDEKLTLDGSVMGTPAYMSPEQANGENERVGPAADQYSLGCALYELLTGHTPFTGPPGHQIFLHATETPASPRSRRKDVPGDLDTIVMKCLEKDPARRYPSCLALAEDLRRWQAGETIKARRVGQVELLVKWANRNKGLAASLAVTILALVAGTTLSTVMALKADQKASDADKAAKREGEQYARAEESRRSEATQRRLVQDQLVSMFRDQGHRAAQADDRFTAALAYSHALAVETDPARAAVLRTQITTALSRTPRQAWLHQAGSAVRHAAFSPDGSKAVLSGADGQARILDAVTGKPIGAPLPHQGPVLWTAFSPDGTRVATGSADKTARVWDAATGKPVTEAIRHPGWVRQVMFDATGTKLITSGGACVPLSWDAATGKPLFDPNREVEVNQLRYEMVSRQEMRREPDGRDVVVVVTERVPVQIRMRTRLLEPGQPAVQHMTLIGDDRILVLGETGEVAVRTADRPDNAPPSDVFFREGGPVKAVANPAGDLIAVACQDGDVRLYPAGKEKQTRADKPVVAHHHLDGCGTVAFSPNGKYLASGGMNMDAVIVRVEALKSVKSKDILPPVLPPNAPEPLPSKSPPEPVPPKKKVAEPPGVPVVFLDAARVEPVDEAGLPAHPKIELAQGQGNTPPTSPIDLPSPPDRPFSPAGMQQRLPESRRLSHSHSVNLVVFSPDSRFLLTASEDQTARVWDVETGEPVSPPLRHAAAVRFAAWSPDGKSVLTCGEDGLAKKWDVDGLPPADLVVRHGAEVNHVAFSPDGRTVVSAGDDGRARLWDADTGRPFDVTLKHDARIFRAAFDSSGKRIATAGDDHNVSVWDAVTGVEALKLRHTTNVRDVAFTADGRRLLAVAQDGNAVVWDTATGKPWLVCRDPDLITPVPDAAPSRENTRPPAAIAPPSQLNTVEQNARQLRAAIDRSGRYVVTSALGANARVWDVEHQKPEPLHTLTATSGAIYHADFSPDGRRIVTAGTDGARVWDTQTGRPVTPVMRQRGALYAATFSEDGGRIVTAGSDGTARVWDATTGKPVSPPMPHERYVHRAWFSKDGTRVLTVSASTARVWDAVNGQPLTPPFGHGHEVTWASFDSTNRRIVTGGRDGSARVWRIPDPDPRPVADLQELASRLAWQRYDEHGQLVPLEEAAVVASDSPQEVKRPLPPPALVPAVPMPRVIDQPAEPPAAKKPNDADVGELVVAADTKLDPSKKYGRIVIAKSGVTIDGNGVTLTGPTPDKPNGRTGVAVAAKDVSKVTLKNLKARGWETGLRVENGSEWVVENCDFSDNFHDPDFGWGENGIRGGIVLKNVSRSALRKNRAGRVWDGCVLLHCDENTLEDNDFTHASNTCLKLWNSSRNKVTNNRLDYGIRIKKDEVHARDSACVLLESGSDDNRFVGNSITHGGDGVFIRSLNHWVSVGNRFEKNDCSFANNNAVECWSPRNTFVNNKANHSSYGFWMGGSDKSVLVGNEASHNGDPKGSHNSPHLPDNGHAGIVFLFGPGSHLVIRGNTCVGNNGAGIALIGDQGGEKRWKAYHAVLEQNVLRENRWGIYLQNADWIDLAGNKHEKNTEDLKDAGNVTRMTDRGTKDSDASPPKAVLSGPTVVTVGEDVAFDASTSTDPKGNKLTYAWDLGDGATSDKPRTARRYERPGFYRVGVTVTNGRLSDLAWIDLYVTDKGEEPATEKTAGQWTWIDAESKVKFADDRETKLVGDSSLRADVSPYGGGRCALKFAPKAGEKISLKGKKQLTFWIRFRNDNIPAWQGENPIITVQENGKVFCNLLPKDDPLNNLQPGEAREGWFRKVVPLAGSDRWTRQGVTPAELESLSFAFDSWGGNPLHIWIDGLRFE